MKYFIRAGNDLINVERIQAVRVRDNGVLNVWVGDSIGSRVLVVLSNEEANANPFFVRFFGGPEPDRGDIIDLPRIDDSLVSFGKECSDEDGDEDSNYFPIKAKKCTCGPSEGCTTQCDRPIRARKRIG